MAIQTPGCCDTEWQLLFKILESLPSISTGAGGGGDVTGPAGAVDGNIAVFDGATGKIIEDSGVAIGDIITSDDLQSGAEPIGAGVTVVPVVFPTPFSAPPHVVISTSRPTADSSIGSNVMSDTITALGFSARMASATPNANYILQWMAHL